MKHRLGGAPIVVDVGGGYGGAVVLRLKDNEIKPMPFNGANESLAKTKDGQLAFANRRAEALWKFREALDPDQPDGSAIALPPDPELRADLCTPTWKLTARGILIESKEEIRKRPVDRRARARPPPWPGRKATRLRCAGCKNLRRHTGPVL